MKKRTTLEDVFMEFKEGNRWLTNVSYRQIVSLRKFLIKRIRSMTETFTYTSVMEDELGLSWQVSYDRGTTGSMLGIINYFEESRDRPKITFVVVDKNTELPSKDIFKYYPNKTGLTDRRFIQKEQERVRDFWKNDENYEKFKDDI